MRECVGECVNFQAIENDTNSVLVRAQLCTKCAAVLPSYKPSQALSCHSALDSGRVKIASFSVLPREVSD